MSLNKYYIIIGSDHGGFEFKQEIIKILKNKNYIFDIEDIGCYNTESCDYPEIGKEVAKKIINKNIDTQKNKKENIEKIGILICGTGIGISISANKVKGIRCSLIHDCYTAKMTKEHNHPNCIAFGGRIKYSEKIEKILDSFFLAEKSTEKRHLNRIFKIES